MTNETKNREVQLTCKIGDRAGTYSYSYEWNLDVPVGISPIMEGLMQKGFGETLRDAFSTFKKKENGVELDASPSEKHQATLNRLGKLKDGSYVFGAGGGGGGQSPEVKGWLAFFKAEKTKIRGKLVSGKTLRAAQETLCRQDLIGEFDPGTPERADVEANIGKHLAERFDEWKELVENDSSDPIGQLIANERTMASIDTTSRGSRLRGKKK